MASGRVVFRVHAVRRMSKRVISKVQVRDVLENGQIIEENTQDETIVVTVSEPEPERWTDGFRRRKKP